MIKSTKCLKGIHCRLHNTEWSLVRLEKPDFEHTARVGIVGHPAYYRIVPQDEEPEIEGRIRQSEVDARARGYEVWPLPAAGVEVVPHYESDTHE